MEMYEVVARNCKTNPKIKYSRKDMTKATAIFVATNLIRGFRQVDILNQDTGEVMYSFYMSDDFFKAELSEYEAMELVDRLF
jgi:hypothetical protein